LEKINGELELAKKKKQALDKLFNEGKVSQSTYDSFSSEVAEAIADIEAKQTTLMEKMETKINELEQQMNTLEHLLVNSEIRHVSGELDEEAYNRECNVLSLGLETTKQELNLIKEAISNLSEQNTGLPPTPPTQLEEETADTEPEPEPEPETEKRLEIVMDTETTTSVETTVEEQPAEEEAEVSAEQSTEHDGTSIETQGEPSEEAFSEETPYSEDPESSAAVEDAQIPQDEASQDESDVEELAPEQD
jgi:hypothetical protein